MKRIRRMAAAAALLLAASAVPAQPGPGAGSGPGAMAPHGGPGRMGGRSGAEFTPGWSMMSPSERQEHQAKMRSMANYDECKAYMEQHHQQMAARAKEKGGAVPAQPRRDPCAGLKR